MPNPNREKCEKCGNPKYEPCHYCLHELPSTSDKVVEDNAPIITTNKYEGHAPTTSDKGECEHFITDPNCSYCANGYAPTNQSDFSNFFRNASHEEKEKVFREVAEKASEEQRKLIEDTKQSESVKIGIDPLAFASGNGTGVVTNTGTVKSSGGEWTMDITDIQNIRNLAHAYQEVFQPADDKDFDYRWGVGFHKGLEFALDGAIKLLLSQREEIARIVEDEMTRIEGAVKEYRRRHPQGISATYLQAVVSDMRSIASRIKGDK